jgi:hypothetical protein
MSCSQVIRYQNSSEGCTSLSPSVSNQANDQIGSYHYWSALLPRPWDQADIPSSGVEASSSASLAAYLNSLQFSIEDSQAWFAKGSGWRVTGGTYWYVSLIQVMRQEEVADEVAASMLSQEWISGWT